MFHFKTVSSRLVLSRVKCKMIFFQITANYLRRKRGDNSIIDSRLLTGFVYTQRSDRICGIWRIEIALYVENFTHRRQNYYALHDGTTERSDMYMRVGGGRKEHDTVMTQTSCILVPHKAIRVHGAAHGRVVRDARVSVFTSSKIAPEIDSLPFGAKWEGRRKRRPEESPADVDFVAGVDEDILRNVLMSLHQIFWHSISFISIAIISPDRITFNAEHDLIALVRRLCL